MKCERIEINPHVVLGKPVIRGTRIPVELILRKLGEGATEAELLEQYELAGDAYVLRLKSGNGSLRSLVTPGFDIPIRAIFDEEASLTELRRLARC